MRPEPGLTNRIRFVSRSQEVRSPVMRVLLLDLAAGIGLLATIILSARRAPQKRPRHVRALGWMLVAGPLPLVVVLHAAGRLPPTADQVTFLSAVAAFAIGAALVLSA